MCGSFRFIIFTFLILVVKDLNLSFNSDDSLAVVCLKTLLTSHVSFTHQSFITQAELSKVYGRLDEVGLA